jgi:hypothetical protein
MMSPPGMIKAGHGRTADEGGAILVLALGILIVLGILVGALAGLAAPSFAHASVVRNVNDTVASADSGIEYAIQSLKATPGGCLIIPAQAPMINDRNAVVSCTPFTLPAGTPAGISGFVLVSKAQIGSGSADTIQSTAVIEINDDTGSPTVMSWTTCHAGEC